MPSPGRIHFAIINQGGVARDPRTLSNHLMPGAADQDLLQNAVSMEVVPERDAGTLTVTVSITNDQTGHHVPTDSPSAI